MGEDQIKEVLKEKKKNPIQPNVRKIRKEGEIGKYETDLFLESFWDLGKHLCGDDNRTYEAEHISSSMFKVGAEVTFRRREYESDNCEWEKSCDEQGSHRSISILCTEDITQKQVSWRFKCLEFTFFISEVQVESF